MERVNNGLIILILQAKKGDSPPPSMRTRRATAAALLEDEREAPKSTSKLASPKHESKYSKLEKTEKSLSLPGRLSTLSKVCINLNVIFNG